MIDLARVRHVVFDFDGTLSLLTGGWSDLMTDLFVEHLPPMDNARSLARREILLLNGRPSIHQMTRLAELITERGGTPAEARVYHATFLDRLHSVVAERRAAVESGRVSAETMLVPGARAMLEALHARGLPLTLLSGSELSIVRKEARLLALDTFFEAIIAPEGDDHSFTKRTALERIVQTNALRGDELLAFGDGPAEIVHTRALGGTAIGIACVEADPLPGHIDEIKREVLLTAGAQEIIADFRNVNALFTA